MSVMLDKLLEHKIVAILRNIEDHDADQIAQALLDGGIRLMEVTLNTKGALNIIDRWRSTFGHAAAIGAGTVLDVAMAKEAVAAGAQFLISPNLDEEVVVYGKTQGVSVWPGVMTPTEIVRAVRAGAEAVKLFPMGTLGSGYLSEIRGPLDQVPLLATGGVDLHTIAEYFKNGANAVGIGGKLVNPEWVKQGDFERITAHVRQLVEAAKAAGK